MKPADQFNSQILQLSNLVEQIVTETQQFLSIYRQIVGQVRCHIENIRDPLIARKEGIQDLQTWLQTMMQQWGRLMERYETLILQLSLNQKYSSDLYIQEFKWILSSLNHNFCIINDGLCTIVWKLSGKPAEDWNDGTELFELQKMNQRLPTMFLIFLRTIKVDASQVISNITGGSSTSSQPRTASGMSNLAHLNDEQSNPELKTSDIDGTDYDDAFKRPKHDTTMTKEPPNLKVSTDFEQQRHEYDGCSIRKSPVLLSPTEFAYVLMALEPQNSVDEDDDSEEHDFSQLQIPGEKQKLENYNHHVETEMNIPASIHFGNHQEQNGVQDNFNGLDIDGSSLSFHISKAPSSFVSNYDASSNYNSIAHNLPSKIVDGPIGGNSTHRRIQTLNIEKNRKSYGRLSYYQESLIGYLSRFLGMVCVPGYDAGTVFVSPKILRIVRSSRSASMACPPNPKVLVQTSNSDLDFVKEGQVFIHGTLYNISAVIQKMSNHTTIDYMKLMRGKELSSIFMRESAEYSNCFDYISNITAAKPCNWNGVAGCFSLKSAFEEDAKLYYSWSDVSNKSDKAAYNGYVIDLSQYFSLNKTIFGVDADRSIRKFAGRDLSFQYANTAKKVQLAKCLVELYGIGRLDEENFLCFTAKLLQLGVLVTVSGLIFAKFILSWYFAFALSRQLGKIEASRSIFSKKQIPNERLLVTAITHPQEFSLFHSQNFSIQYKELYAICTVTCYSEDLNAVKMTLDSLAMTDYSDQHKLIFIIVDGVVTGVGNDKPTGDIILDILELDEAIHAPFDSEIINQKRSLKCRNAEPQLYESIGSGNKRINMAKVYCGTYVCQDRRVAAILVYKCGTPSESNSKKPGNRGKRDSQVILMDFLSKIMFHESLSPLQFDLFIKFSHIMTVQNLATKKITPDMFEIVLMVDADTRVMPDSLSRMISVMQRDPTVMGLCGETRIMNKTDSYISMIQVFEYFVGHHFSKAFESIFGGVTCLPGCFCMYRIKSPKPISKSNYLPNIDPELQSTWVPVLANPDIVYDYSRSAVDTLHKKNLLLLGEDRYLSTLMLRTFPKRKMMFVPKAVCETTVPNNFRILLSQRRRWINSTIHNLMELILVRELCGTFCFSMQFVVFLELVGTATLPATITFTFVMLALAFFNPAFPVLPLIFLAVMMFLPSLLIVMTTRNPLEDLFYMIVYFTSLPIWNLILPIYAFWNFDDFSWGQTRPVIGDKNGDNCHGTLAEGYTSDVSSVPLKHWAEWARIRRDHLKQANLRDPFGLVTKYIDQSPRRVKKSSKFSIIAKKLGFKKDRVGMTSSAESLLTKWEHPSSAPAGFVESNLKPSQESSKPFSA